MTDVTPDDRTAASASILARLDRIEQALAGVQHAVGQLLDAELERTLPALNPEQLEEIRAAATATAVRVADRIRAAHRELSLPPPTVEA